MGYAKLFTNNYMWLFYNIKIHQIMDIIVEGSSHVIKTKVLTLILTRIGGRRRKVSLLGVVSVTPTTGSTTLVLVPIGVVSSPLLTSTTSLVALVTTSLITLVTLVLVIPPLVPGGNGVVTATVAIFGALVVVRHQVGSRALGEVLNAIFVSGEYEMLLPFSKPLCSPSHPQCRILPISLMVCIGV